MDYLVFDDEQDAQDTANLIYQRGAYIAAQRGYEVDQDGIVGKSLNGVDLPEAQKTQAWDIPRQRLDGKWVVAHPNSHPSAQNEIAPGVTYLAYAMNGITATVETETADWWPVQEI